MVLQAPYLLKNFYLTGGTALSYWHLHHRISDDLDFFSEAEINILHILRWLESNSKKAGFISFAHEDMLGFHFLQLKYPDGGVLKVDFGYYPSERIEKGLSWKGLSIDSLYDIAINKYQTIGMSPRAKDYVDLYFILKDKDWTIEQLARDAGAKHGIHAETIQMAKVFLRVAEFRDFPKMLVPFNRDEMVEFYLSLAKNLKKDIFK